MTLIRLNGGIKNVILQFFKNFKAWFCSIDLKNLTMFNRTYYNQLIIVTEALENADAKKAKKAIHKQMVKAGMNEEFRNFLMKQGIFTDK